MTINSINGANTRMGQMGMNQAADSYSRNIQNQIADAQKQLQELSSNEDMSLEERMKKRQEIQKQISDLNVQLRQHQMEQRKAAMGGSEKQQAKGSSMDDMTGAVGNAGSKSSGLSQANMTAMISAGTSMKQAKVQGSVAAKMEGRAGVLESEIKLDQARGGDTQKKEEELADIEEKAQAAASSQLSTLGDASKTMEEAAKVDSREEKTENVSGADTMEEMHSKGETVSDTESVNTKSDLSVSSSTAPETTTQQPTAYVSVDIRL